MTMRFLSCILPMLAGSNIFSNRAVIIAGSFPGLRIVLHFCRSLPQNQEPSRIPLVSACLNALPSSQPQSQGVIEAKAQVDGDVHYGGKEIFDGQKFLVRGAQLRCYNLANATEV